MHAWRSLVVVAALFASATVAGGGQPAKTSNVGRQTASASTGLKGAWKIVEQLGRTPGGEWTVGATPSLSLYIFTDKHYSYMFVPGLAPRRLFAGDPNQPTDAEKVAALQFLRCGFGHVHADRIHADPERCYSQKPQRDEWARVAIRRRDARFDIANDDCQSSVCARSRTPNRIGPTGVAHDSGGALQEPGSKIVPNTQPAQPTCQ